MESCSTQAVLPLVGLAADKAIRDQYSFQAVGFVPVQSCSMQAVLPLVGLAADKAIRDQYSFSTTAVCPSRARGQAQR
ncbi:MAG: hypothetical protein ACQESR_07895 [Planctomycetota bacterium]